MNYPAAELRGIKMIFFLINPDAEHRGILLIKNKKRHQAASAKGCPMMDFEGTVHRSFASTSNPLDLGAWARNSKMIG